MNRAIVPQLLMLICIFSLAACQQVNKPEPPFSVNDLDNIKEPSLEEESLIQLTINFNGKWRKNSTGSKTIILIQGKTGRIIGKNGGEIPIRIQYLNEKTLKIYEYEYNSQYLENWFSKQIAQQIYQNELLSKTYSILKIVDENTLIGISHSWQVFHSSSAVVQSIEPLTTPEEWKRIVE